MANLGIYRFNDFGETSLKLIIQPTRRMAVRIWIARRLIRLAAWVLKIGLREQHGESPSES